MGEGTEQEKFTVNQEIKEYETLNAIVHPDLNQNPLALLRNVEDSRSLLGLPQIGAR